MNLYINGIEKTGYLEEGSLVLRHFGARRSSFGATLYIADGSALPPIGSEILIEEGAETVWGGILIDIECECHSSSSATVRLRGQGFEQVLYRRCLPAMQFDQSNPTDVAVSVFNDYFAGYEGLSLGIVDRGIGSHSFTLYPSRASTLMDYLAKETGYYWWVNKYKVFNMRKSLADDTLQVVDIDLTKQSPQRLTDLQTLTYRSSTAGYRNYQYAYNRNTHVYGYSLNQKEINRMSRIFGTGEYGGTATSYSIHTMQDGDEISEQILNGMPGTDEIEFTTDAELFGLDQTLRLRAPIFGVSAWKRFCVTQIRAVWFYDAFRYTVTAKEILGNHVAVGSSWEETLAGIPYTESEE